MKKSIAVDMDGVIADTETHFLNWYEREYGVRIGVHEIQGREENEMFPDKTVARKFAFTPGFFRSLPVMTGAVEALKTLMKSYDVYIVSAAMEFPQSLPEKLEWLKEHFPFISWRNIIFCGDKSIIGTDYMIDDHIKNLDFFKGTTIMFHAFHNVNHNHHQRANNWDEVLKLLVK
ncbi:5' nucleotidase, NT5C type [Mucilaginibacter xinganensis]|uniref:5'(3')-deoxyribonucleotidase n=1 Tax=Mucilaginibacter xinganensis TaxID=1234841 RepID=A0A223NU64_9SPHI|nr:5'(3')-deoxyribonucleotidase [Mucilaginibacter xinganensis]ASU33051.1 5'(3')-deoxyribonucleotidase [Mucilaginibacter xinganensis]